MERHGAATVGRDLEQAFYRLETLETVAKMYRDSSSSLPPAANKKITPPPKPSP